MKKTYEANFTLMTYRHVDNDHEKPLLVPAMDEYEQTIDANSISEMRALWREISKAYGVRHDKWEKNPKGSAKFYTLIVRGYAGKTKIKKAVTLFFSFEIFEIQKTNCYL